MFPFYVYMQLSWGMIILQHQQGKLEQLECLRSEIPPPPHDYPY